MNPDDSKPPHDSRSDLNQKRKPDREVLESLIRSELADAKGTLHDLNRSDLQKIAAEHFKPKLDRWINTSAFLFATVVIGLFVAFFEIPRIIERKTQTYIEEKLIGPALTNTVDNVISNKATVIIDTRLNPLKINVNLLEGTIVALSLDVSNKQVQLASQQVSINDQQHVQGLLVKAKNGSLAAYRELQAISSQTNTLADIATAAETEINLFFDAYRFRTYRIREFEDLVSGNPIQLPLDLIVICDLNSPSWTQRETAVTKLAEAKKDNTVPHLCEQLFIETNLFVVADITKAFGDITGQRLDALDIDFVKQWWDTNKHLPKYQSPYRSLQQFASNGWGLVLVPVQQAKDSIPLLKEVVEADPTAWWSRCLLGSCYTFTGDFTNADKEFSETEKNFPDFGILYFDKTFLLLNQKNTDKAVESLNKALEQWPSLVNNARDSFPAAFLTDPRIHWPSNSTNSVSPKTP